MSSAHLTPLSVASIRARRRPIAILVVYAAELLWALVVATPAHAWARHAWGAHPDGDAVLFAPGGRHLLAWIGQEDSGLPITVRTTMILLFVGVIAMQVPLGALITSLAFARTTEDARERAPRTATALGVGIASFAPLTGLLVLGALPEIVVLAAGAITASALDHGLVDRLGDARSFTVRLVTYAIFGVMAALVGVVLDLARVAVAREVGLSMSAGARSPGLSIIARGARTALRAARRHMARASLAWAARTALGLALVGAGYVASRRLGGRGGGALVALFVVHQAVTLGRAALRASWLARALAIVVPLQDAHNEQRAQEAHDEQRAQGTPAAEGAPAAEGPSSA